jgi:hypothetical protein
MAPAAFRGTPLLSWDPVAQSWEYDIEIATDAGFSNVVYTATVANASHTVATMLDSNTTYYWHVRGVNTCDSGAYSSTFTFSTLTQTDYFTELFEFDFDLDGLSLWLIPDGSGSYYDACTLAISDLPTDPAGGTVLDLADDGSANITPANPMSLYGISYESLFVNANGNLTFVSADNTYNHSIERHFNAPRISPMFDDLNPENGGTVSWKETPDRVAITWQEVPEYPAAGANTFQVELLSSGEIHLSWLGITSTGSVVGVSAGNGVPDGFLETDLSAQPACYSLGACCVAAACSIESEADCTTLGGQYLGDDTTCDPNPCGNVPGCLIISEVVDGTLSGGCPKWIEITNTGLNDFTFIEGGIIVQDGKSTDRTIDVDLAGHSIRAGECFVVCSNHGGTCTGAFPIIYQIEADLYTNVLFGDGDDRYLITDTADGSNILDIYGEFGVDGTGTAWEYTEGFSYRQPEWCGGAGMSFDPIEWHLAGPGSLQGSDPVKLLLANTNPGVHAYDLWCSILGDIDGDGDLDLADGALFMDCLAGPDVYVPPPGVDPADFAHADLDRDFDVDLGDFARLQQAFGTP